MMTHIVMAPATRSGRGIMEDAENKVFEKMDDIVNHFGTPVKVFTLSEFMDACNNEEVLLETSWITYVRSKRQ